MSGTLWKLGGSLAAGVAALTMVFWGLERSALVDAAVRLDGESESIPTRVYVLVFVGLLVFTLALVAALSVWGGYLKAHPETRQLPVWVLIVLIVVAGTAGFAGFAQHASYVRSLPVVPTEVSQGYIAYEVIAAAMVVVALVILGVRWAPGYRPTVRPPRR